MRVFRTTEDTASMLCTHSCLRSVRYKMRLHFYGGTILNGSRCIINVLHSSLFYWRVRSCCRTCSVLQVQLAHALGPCKEIFEICSAVHNYYGGHSVLQAAGWGSQPLAQENEVCSVRFQVITAVKLQRRPQYETLLCWIRMLG